MFQKVTLFFILLVASATVFAQNEKKYGLVKGWLQNKSNKAPVMEIQVSIPYLKLLTSTDAKGAFSFSHVAFGNQRIVMSGTGIKTDTITIVVNKEIVNLGVLDVIPDEASFSHAPVMIPVIALEDNDGGDEDGGGMQVSGLLSASRDPFLNAAAFVFGPYRFQARGYDRNLQQVMINGAPMNDVETGDAYWSQWGGLNDVFRSRSNTYGLQPSDYTFGGLNGSTCFDATALIQRKQTRVTYSLSNRQYRNRLMATYNSGLMKNGWAWSVSGSKRWAKEGYAEGTFFNGYSYYLAAGKRIGSGHELNFTAFGASAQRGKTSPSYQKAYNLTSNYYNPNWGYQNGEKRNAKVAKSFQPVFILNHEYTPAENMYWNTTLAYQFGKNANSTLDWYNAADPRPDYYKYLPNYYLFANPQNPFKAEENRIQFVNNHQLNWDALYQANYANLQAIPNTDGSPGTDSGRRSLYVLGNDIDAVKKWILNTSLQRVINDRINFYAGFSYIRQKTESYRELMDLLGGDFFINVNSFTERNISGTTIFNQNDLNHPYRLIKEGDKYYYDYNLYFNKSIAWMQGTFALNHFDLFMAVNYGMNSFQREGNYRNGLFAGGNSSYGKADKERFRIYGAKAGITYKINGRNYLFVNTGMAVDAPAVDNTYFAARTRNATIENPVTQKSYSVEGGYILHAPKLNGRMVGYATDQKDKVEIQRFYYQGTGSANTMVDYVLQGLNTRCTGMEMALEYKAGASLSLTGVAALGQAFYTNNPRVSIYQENTHDIAIRTDSVYLKNYYMGVGPQSAYTLGINYRSPNYWYANINFNYFDRNYIDIAAPRRTRQTVDLVTPGSKQWHTVLDQERFPSAFSLDLFCGKSFLLSKESKKLPRNTFLYVNIGVSNILDNKEIRTGGFENPRYDYSGGFANKYGSKYFYSIGLNYFINLSLKF